MPGSPSAWSTAELWTNRLADRAPSLGATLYSQLAVVRLPAPGMFSSQTSDFRECAASNGAPLCGHTGRNHRRHRSHRNDVNCLAGKEMRLLGDRRPGHRQDAQRDEQCTTCCFGHLIILELRASQFQRGLATPSRTADRVRTTLQGFGGS